MSLQRISAAEAAANLARYTTVIDVRSPAEHAEDHLPGAQNWPVLDDEQRRIVGTCYKQVSAFEARKIGAAMVARNIADHIDRWVATRERDWLPLVYCWRGGERSGTLAWFLDRIGFRTAVVQGGYKAFRAVVRQDLIDWPARHDWRVLCGKTGTGKTRLLQRLRAHGAQVLDLEALAVHRGSVLGLPPGQSQPGQKALDTRIWQAMRDLDPSRPVYVESESKKLGQRWLPDALIATLRERGRCVCIEMPDDARLALLMEDYRHLHEDPEHFGQLLAALTELRGKAVVARWQDMARAGNTAQVFAELMRLHYDPGYLQSLGQHFRGLATAEVLEVADGGEASLDAAAQALLRQG